MALTAGELLTAFADDGVVAAGESEDELVGFGGAGGGFDFFGGGVGFAIGDVLADGAVEEEDILADKADCAAQGGVAEIGEGEAVEGDLPGNGIVEPEEEADNGGFSGAGGADDGMGFAGGNVHRNAFEDGGARDVAEGDVLEFDFALDGGGEVFLTFDHLGLGVEKVLDAVGTGEEALELVEGFAEAGEGPEEALGHEDEDGIDSDAEGAIEGEPSADEEGSGEPGEDSHADEGDKCGGELDGFLVGGAVFVADGGEAFGFAGFGGEGFDGGDSAEVGREGAAESGDGFADFGVAGFEPFLVEDAAPDDDRDWDHGEGGDEEGTGGEYGSDEDDVPEQADETGCASIEEAFELVDVVVEDAEQSA